MNNEEQNTPKSVTVTYTDIKPIGIVKESKTLTGDKAGYDFIRHGDATFFKAWAGIKTLIIPLSSLVSFEMEG